MAKEKGKKFKRKGKKFGQPNATIKKVKVPMISQPEANVPAPPAPLTDPAEVTASDPGSNDNGASQGIEKERENVKHLSGFIFMCNSSTKLDCYQYRVFGLPSGKKEVVEEIKPGTKLFLFDFESKLLYGIYVATSAGKLNLEPAAFRGKFPAQVKFKIFKECLPLPESSLRHIIKENYSGSKFKQELSRKQVRKLLSSFRPLTASSSLPAPQALANVHLSRTMPPSAMENQLRHIVNLPAIKAPYLAEMQYSRVPPLGEPQPVPRANYLQYGYHRPAAYVEHVNPTADHRSLPATSNYYVSNSQRQPFNDGVSQGLQGPSYSRYRTVEERAPRDQVTILERHHQMPLPQPHGSVAYHQLPLQRGTQYQETAVAYNSNPAGGAHYAASVSQSQVPASYHQLPLQREPLYRDNAVAYNSYPTASASWYSSSVAQPPQVAAPGISQGTAPIALHYSYTAANHLSR